MKKRTHIKRYPFGRWTLTRETIAPKYRLSCDWCGFKLGKFVYWVEDDGGRDSKVKGTFCSVNCMKVYHNFND